MFANEIVDIEKKLEEIYRENTNPVLAQTIQDVRDTFKNRRVLLADLAYRDLETGLYNSFYLHSQLTEEIARATRYNRNLTLMEIRMGPSFEEIFIESAQSIDTLLRKNDICSVTDPLTLAVILPETGTRESEKVARKIYSTLTENNSIGNPSEVWIGISDMNRISATPETFIETAHAASLEAELNDRPVSIVPE